MGNLDLKQQEVIRGGVGYKKFVDIAKEARCTIEQVKQFAPVVFAERQQAQIKKWHEEEEAAAKARQEAEEKFTAECKAALAAGDRDALFQLWSAEYAEEVADEVLESEAADDVRRDARAQWEEENEDNVKEIRDEYIAFILDQRADDIAEYVQEEIEEYYGDEVREIVEDELQEEIAAAQNKAFDEFIATLKTTQEPAIQ